MTGFFRYDKEKVLAETPTTVERLAIIRIKDYA